MIGLGYNFENYDFMFSKMAFNLQNSINDIEYSFRYKAMQYLLQPFCSEYGIEVNRPLYRTHRELYAIFFKEVSGEDMPGFYPSTINPWLRCSKQWAEIMNKALDTKGLSPKNKVIYNVAYHWAVEHLSISEFNIMRAGWKKLGISSDYLNAHCSVEEEHGSYAAKAVYELSESDNPIVIQAIRDHEQHLKEYYVSLSLIPCMPEDRLAIA